MILNRCYCKYLNKNTLLETIKSYRSLGDIDIDLLELSLRYKEFPSEILADLLNRYKDLHSIDSYYNAFIHCFKCDVEMFETYKDHITNKNIGCHIQSGNIPLDWLALYHKINKKKLKSKDKRIELKAISEDIDIVCRCIVRFNQFKKDTINHHIPDFLSVDKFNRKRVKFILKIMDWYFYGRQITEMHEQESFIISVLFDDKYDLKQAALLYRLAQGGYRLPYYPVDILKLFTPDISYNKMLNKLYRILKRDPKSQGIIIGYPISNLIEYIDNIYQYIEMYYND